MKNDSIGKFISSIYRHQSIIINNQFEQYGFGTGQYIFFIHIAKNEGINQKDLSEILKIDRANTNRAIKKLEQLGYIYTIEDEKDKRNRKSYLTDQGKKLMPKAKNKLTTLTEIMAKGMNDTDRKYLFKLLELVEKNVEEEVNKLRKEKTNDCK